MKVSFFKKYIHLKNQLLRFINCCMLATLVACGGTSSNDSSNASNPTGSNSANNNSDSNTQLQGFYQATVGVGNKEFVSLVLPSSGGSSQWYGWYFKGPTLNADPYLYSGNLILGVNGAAQTNGASIRIYESGTLGLRSASFSQSSLTSFQATISNAGTQTSETMTATAQGILQTSLQGTWTGTWSSKGSILPNKDIVLDANGASTSMDAIGTCNNNNTLRLTGSTIYTASITINGATNCDWSALNAPSKTLTGVGFVHLSTIAGKNRLELILLDTDGSGISFRGDK